MASKLAGGEVVLDHGTFKADQPPLAPKRKLKIDRKKSNVEWQWAPFTNQAREDGAFSASFDFLTPSARLASSRQGRGWPFFRFLRQFGPRRYSTQVSCSITGKKKAWNLPSTPTRGLIRS